MFIDILPWCNYIIEEESVRMEQDATFMWPTIREI